jgi:hypothetical protein
VLAPTGQARGASGDAIRSIGTDEDWRSGASSVDRHDDSAVGDLDVLNSDAVTELGTDFARLLRQVGIQDSPLRHQHRQGASTFDSATVAESKLEAINDLLDNRVNGKRELLQRSRGECAAARLDPREASAINEEDGCTCMGKPVRGD